MTNPANERKQPYNTPQFERYGNVRDLTHASANSGNQDGKTNTKMASPGRTH